MQIELVSSLPPRTRRRRPSKYEALLIALDASAAGQWLRIPLIDIPGATPRGKRMVLISAARHAGISVHVRLDGAYLYICRQADGSKVSDNLTTGCIGEEP